MWQAVCSHLVPERSGEAELAESRDVASLGAPASVKKTVPSRAITEQHGRTRDPRLITAWLIMTAHAWVTMRHSRAAQEGNTVMWKWLGCQQLLDMVSRAKSGFLSVFELVFFLLVLSGCPELTYQARTKGRWNKGGKWWWATMTVMCCDVCNFKFWFEMLSCMFLYVFKWSEDLMDFFRWSWGGTYSMTHQQHSSQTVLVLKRFNVFFIFRYMSKSQLNP